MTLRQIEFLQKAGGVFGEHKLTRHPQMSSVTFVTIDPYPVDPPVDADDYQAFFDVCDAAIAREVELESSASNWELENPNVYTTGEMTLVSTQQRVVFFRLEADIKDLDRGRKDGKLEDTFAVVYCRPPDGHIPDFGGRVVDLFAAYGQELRDNTHYHASKGVLDSRDDFDILDI